MIVFTCIFEKSSAPNQFNDVKPTKNSRIAQIEKIVVSRRSQTESNLLEDDQSDESDC